jgi:protein gp37
MGKDSKISWTDHSYNPWHGCTPISPACDHCYARRLAERTGHNVWGHDAPRRFFGEKHWGEPLKWDRNAQKEGTRARVFCGSMCDVFEGRHDLDSWRLKLWGLIETTKNLDWLLLTKRPHNILKMVPEAWGKAFPSNVWLGVTAESQQEADERIPDLLSLYAKIRFVSAEPLLGPINFSQYNVNWILVGGESGPEARRMDPMWAGDIIFAARQKGIAVHFKQLGVALAKEMGCKESHGLDPTEWPERFRIQQFPE